MSDYSISLNSESEEKVFSLYEKFYNYEKSYEGPRFKISSSRCIIPRETFIKILNDCIILSLQTIEDRPISTKFLFPNMKNGTSNWPKGVKFIPVEELSFPNINLQDLKKFLEMASDPNTFLIIDFSGNDKNESEFNFTGFMFVEKSLNSLIFKSELERLELKQKNLKEPLGCLYDSVIFSIDKGRVKVSYLNEPFITIEKGTILETPKFDIESGFVAILSSGVKDRIQKMIDKNDLPVKKRITIMHLIFDKIRESLKKIVLKISEARHGSTLIFNFEGDVNTEKDFQPDPIKIEVPYGSTLLRLTKLTDPISFRSKEAQEIYNTVEMYENTIISLSKTDGALIFDQHLDLVLVLAGAFLKSKASASLSGGARRKSAEGFVRDNKNTMAITISQDGNITIIAPLFDKLFIKDNEQFNSIEY